MTETADAIVIGAGINGASIAYHLARRGVRPLVLDRGAIGSGATGRSSGLVRLHYADATNAALAWASFPYFSAWSEVVGEGDPGFVRTGFLQIEPPAEADLLRRNVAGLQARGVPTFLVTAEDVARIAPFVRTDDFEIAAYEPESGYADPAATTASFLAAARRLGAAVRPSSAVLGIDTSGDRVVGAITDDGRIAAPIVVLAAGAWAAQLARTIGLDVPLEAWRHDVGFITRPGGWRTRHPAIIDHITATYARMEGHGLTLAATHDDNDIGGGPDDTALVPPLDFAERLVDRICRRLPGLADGGWHSAQRGVDGLTPDQRPILGAAGPDGFYLACGSSGTGFKTAPAVGACIAELIVDGRAATVDIEPLGLGRFEASRELAAVGPTESWGWR